MIRNLSVFKGSCRGLIKICYTHPMNHADHVVLIKKEVSFQRNIKLLRWFNFFTDFRLYAPIAIIYFSHVTHSYALGGSIFSIIYISSALLDVPAGIVADRIGRKKVVTLGSLAMVFGTIFYAIGINYWFLAVGALLEGISRSLYSGNNDALLHNLLSEEGLQEEFHTYSGKLSAMFQIALVTSGLLGAVIANWSFPLVMWLSVIPQIICFGISFQITDAKQKAAPQSHILKDLQEAFYGFKNNANLRMLSYSSIISYATGETVYEFQAAFYNLLIPIWLVGVVSSLSNVFAAIGFYFSGKAIKRFKAISVLLASGIYSKGVDILALIFPTVLSPFVMASTSLFFGLGSTASTSLMQKDFTDKQRATMSSLNSFAGSLAFGILTLIAGLFADHIGPAKALLIIQIISLPSIWLVWKLYKVSQQPH